MVCHSFASFPHSNFNGVHPYITPLSDLPTTSQFSSSSIEVFFEFLIEQRPSSLVSSSNYYRQAHLMTRFRGSVGQLSLPDRLRQLWNHISTTCILFRLDLPVHYIKSFHSILDARLFICGVAAICTIS